MNASTRVERIRAVLEARFAPQALEIIDDSALHAGHAGAREGGHFRVSITAEAFRGCGKLQAHRLVYAALAELMQGEIHALSIDARPPDNQH